jgi:tartrate/fumarate subfamily iron-sulfur-dependent hydro-lyase beta chain
MRGNTTMVMKKLAIPLSESDARGLKAGEAVLLTGQVFTGRSLFHIRAVEKGILPPVDFARANVMLHAGPVMEKVGDGWRVVGVTPTSSIRFEKYGGAVVRLLELRALIGKTTMGEETARAFREVGCVHLTPVGVCGNILARQVTEVKAVHFREEIGNAEATWVYELLEAGPFIVDMDAAGRNLFHEVYRESSRRLAEACGRLGVRPDFEYTNVAPPEPGAEDGERP